MPFDCFGGAIPLGTLTVSDCSLLSNHANFGGGFDNGGTVGSNSSAMLTLNGCTVSRNTASWAEALPGRAAHLPLRLRDGQQQHPERRFFAGLRYLQRRLHDRQWLHAIRNQP